MIEGKGGRPRTNYISQIKWNSTHTNNSKTKRKQGNYGKIVLL